jgi:Zn-dependent metalloprotease
MGIWRLLMSIRFRAIKTYSQARNRSQGVLRSSPRSPSKIGGRPHRRGAALWAPLEPFRRHITEFAVCSGAALLAIALSLLALSLVVLVVGVGGMDGISLSGHPLRVVVEDGAVLFYLAQLVSVSFFNHTAGLRFAALPGLALVALAIAVSAMAVARLIGGSPRRRMLAAMLMPIPYALLAGFGARYLPLRLSGPLVGSDTPVSPAGVEAFLLPLAWGVLFALLGGLLGVFGKSWRCDVARLLGAWATPVRCSLDALAIGLAMTSLVVVVGGAVMIGRSGEVRSFIGGDLGHLVAVAGGALIALPALVVTTFLACFGVSFDWHVEALSTTQGSGSIFGGTLPATSAHQVPGLLGLLLLIATVTVLSAGWLTARRSGMDLRLGIANALRAGVLMTLACWLLALFARVDAQAGGYLGLHFGADVASLLWCVPLWCLFGAVAGSVAYAAIRGAASRRELVTAVRAVMPSSGGLVAADSGWRESWRRGLTSNAALGASFLSVPAMLIGIGPPGASKPIGQTTMSLAPISQAAEQSLRADTVRGSRMAVAVDPNTRVVESARVRLPVSALGVSPDQSPATKAEALLGRYGKLFGMSGHPDELGPAHVTTERITKFNRSPSTHVYFKQMADGIPVYGNSIGIDLASGGKEVRFIDGSFIPEVTLADGKATINSDQAIALAKVALPGGELVHPPRLEVYAGPPSHPFGPTAHLAWFVWLSAGPLRASREYIIDADTGSILNVSNMGFHLEAEHVEIYNGEETATLPGKLVWKEGDTEPKDKDTKYTWEYLKKAWKFFTEGFRGAGCEGYDCTNEEATAATVHYRSELAGGFTYEWNPKYHEIVFGNGWPKALDILGHEYAGGISEYKDPLEKMEGETGALVEGWADAMGKGLEGWVNESGGKWAEPNWKVGLEGPEKKGIRNLEEPSEDHDPANRSEYSTACEDNGDIHDNSTIIGHAFYLLAKKIGIKDATEIFWKMQTANLAGQIVVRLESAPGAAITAAEELFEPGTEVEDTKKAFEEVGLDGHTPPGEIKCPPCPPSRALADQTPVNGAASTLDMLATLYRARGKLAQPSASGHYFMPLYEEHMGRITELVSLDPTLEEMTVDGLRQIDPALNALAEGEGQKYKLSVSEMAQIEAALKRLAQDDRIFSGGGSLATLIERELKWLRLPSYSGMTYDAGFKRLNTAAAQLIQASPPPPTTYLVDPNCEKTYTNVFQVNNFNVSTPGHDKPGEVSPLDASGVACGTKIPLEGLGTCSEEGAKTLNNAFSLKLPPGDQINSTKEMKEGAFVGWTTGHVIACVGSSSKVVSGEEGVKVVKCPGEKGVIACYKLEGTYSTEAGGTTHKLVGVGSAYVKEEAGGRLVLTSESGEVNEEGGEGRKNIPVGFTEFGIKLCAYVGEPGTETCGSHAAPWVHKNGTESQPGCETANENGSYALTMMNKSKGEASAKGCVYWGEHMHKQAVDEGNDLNAISCVPATIDCVTVDNKGNAFYSTNVNATATSTWKSWTGPTGASPSEAVACPSSSLCALADGKAEKGGGNMYYATSLGGAWTEAFKPSNGALAIACPSVSFCVDSQESGRIRYSTSPGSSSWTEVTIGSGSLNSVFCLSSSFCAVVNGSGDLYVADTEAKIKEESGWKKTDVDGSVALHGVACLSTALCVAVDNEGNVVDLAINGSGEATVSKRDLDGANDLTAVTCTSELTCTAVDSKGNILVSTDGSKVWNIQHTLAGIDFTSVSCPKMSLCVTADTSGNITAFAPFPVLPHHTQTIDSGNMVNAVSCIPNAVECVVADSKGNALYSTNVSASTSATWNSWTGLTSPGEAIACPTSTLCAFADGKAEKGGGGDAYYATSVGGTWKEAFAPVWGIDAISCPTSSFCLAGQAEGFIHYSTSPASSEWKTVSIGSSAINAVDCLSASFCAVVDNTGHVRVATTEGKVKEEKGWKSTDIDGTSALHGIACTATTWCVAVDGEGHVLDVMINSGGEATVSTKEDRDGTNSLTAITCTGETCVATDGKGNVFASANEGETWGNEYTFGTDLTGVACPFNTLCLASDTAGEVTAFEPE